MKASQLDPQNAQTLVNLSAAYCQLENYAMGVSFVY